jgi:hypothetical protein
LLFSKRLFCEDWLMPEITKDIVCMVGVIYLLFHISRMVVSIAKMFTDRNKSKSESILHERG